MANLKIILKQLVKLCQRLEAETQIDCQGHGPGGKQDV